jgi:hypothetical protein
VAQAVEDLISTHEVARRIRRHPWAWLAGGTAAGLAAGGLLPGTVLSGARRGFTQVVVPRLKTAVVGLIAAAFAARSHSGDTIEDGGLLAGDSAGRDGGGRP